MIGVHHWTCSKGLSLDGAYNTGCSDRIGKDAVFVVVGGGGGDDDWQRYSPR
jgi:hypothetical protein